MKRNIHVCMKCNINVMCLLGKKDLVKYMMDYIKDGQAEIDITKVNNRLKNIKNVKIPKSCPYELEHMVLGQKEK